MSGGPLGEYTLVFFAAVEAATGLALHTQFESKLRGSHPFLHMRPASCRLATVQIAQPAPDCVVSRCQILLLLFLTAAVTYHQTLELEGLGGPMFSSTSGTAAKTSSVLSALTAY